MVQGLRLFNGAGSRLYRVWGGLRGSSSAETFEGYDRWGGSKDSALKNSSAYQKK